MNGYEASDLVEFCRDQKGPVTTQTIFIQSPQAETWIPGILLVYVDWRGGLSKALPLGVKLQFQVSAPAYDYLVPVGPAMQLTELECGEGYWVRTFPVKLPLRVDQKLMVAVTTDFPDGCAIENIKFTLLKCGTRSYERCRDKYQLR